MIFCYAQSLVPYPSIIRDFQSKWEQIQRSTARHFVEKESKLEISVKSFASEVKELAKEEVKDYKSEGMENNRRKWPSE